ncbi:aldehyde dehydrogenase family protein, partial [Micromonospora foliorum]|uniref:aldehyde dehydrogenase family protein n=1 Tax=Micromonospora foliorum TaxID=2911210 RepID=UPI001EE81004
MYMVAQLVGGVWGAGGDGGELVVRDPADDTPVSTVPVATADEVGKATQAARNAAAQWAATAPAERAAALHRAADAVAPVTQALAPPGTAELGPPFPDPRAGLQAGRRARRRYSSPA